MLYFFWIALGRQVRRGHGGMGRKGQGSHCHKSAQDKSPLPRPLKCGMSQSLWPQIEAQWLDQHHSPLEPYTGYLGGGKQKSGVLPILQKPLHGLHPPTFLKEPKPGRPGFDVQFCPFNMEGSLYNPWIWCPSPHAGLVPASWKAPFKCMQTQAPYIPLFCHT